jgi:hypothetical protein
MTGRKKTGYYLSHPQGTEKMRLDRELYAHIDKLQNGSHSYPMKSDNLLRGYGYLHNAHVGSGADMSTQKEEEKKGGFLRTIINKLKGRANKAIEKKAIEKKPKLWGVADQGNISPPSNDNDNDYFSLFPEDNFDDQFNIDN